MAGNIIPRNNQLLTLTVDGVPISGWSENPKMQWTDTERMKKRVGPQGDYAIVKTGDDSGEITVTLLESSPDIKTLQTLHAGGLPFVVGFTSANPGMGRFVGGKTAYVVMEGPMEFPDEGGQQEFKIWVPNYVQNAV